MRSTEKLFQVVASIQQVIFGVGGLLSLTGAPATVAYKSRSDGIVDVLQDLKEKAEEDLNTLRKAETNDRRNYEMLKQSLEDQVAADMKDMDNTKSGRAASEETKATAEGELAETIKELANSKPALETASSDCMQSVVDHESTLKARAEELKVIAEAKKILVETTKGVVDQTYSFFSETTTSGGDASSHTN